MRIRVGMMVVVMLLCGAGAVRGQVAWEAPMLSPPGNDLGVGIYLMEAAGGGVGAMVHWRTAPSPAGLGLRVGVAEDARDDVSAFGGLDVSGRLTRATAEFPLNIDWIAGVGLSVGEDGVLISAPAGLTVGHTFRGEGIGFTPYLSPRIVLDAAIGDAPGDDLDLDFAADIGLDLQFAPTWLVRFGASIGRDAIAIGVVF